MWPTSILTSFPSSYSLSAPQTFLLTLEHTGMFLSLRMLHFLLFNCVQDISFIRGFYHFKKITTYLSPHVTPAPISDSPYLPCSVLFFLHNTTPSSILSIYLLICPLFVSHRHIRSLCPDLIYFVLDKCLLINE